MRKEGREEKKRKNGRSRRSPDERDEAVDPGAELEVYTPNKLL